MIRSNHFRQPPSVSSSILSDLLINLGWIIKQNSANDAFDDDEMKSINAELATSDHMDDVFLRNLSSLDHKNAMGSNLGSDTNDIFYDNAYDDMLISDILSRDSIDDSLEEFSSRRNARISSRIGSDEKTRVFQRRNSNSTARLSDFMRCSSDDYNDS
jgi:hypothetical protein